MLLKVRSYDFAKEFADSAARILGKTDSYWVRRVNDARGQWFLVKVTSRLLYDFANRPFEELSPVVGAFPASFLRGFYAAEGSVSVNVSLRNGPRLNVGIDLSNTDRSLLLFSRDLLVGLGLNPGAIRVAKRAGFRTNLGIARSDGLVLSLSRLGNVLDFVAKVGFADKEKQAKITDALFLISEMGPKEAARFWQRKYRKERAVWVRQ